MVFQRRLISLTEDHFATAPRIVGTMEVLFLYFPVILLYMLNYIPHTEASSFNIQMRSCFHTKLSINFKNKLIQNFKLSYTLFPSMYSCTERQIFIKSSLYLKALLNLGNIIHTTHPVIYEITITHFATNQISKFIYKLCMPQRGPLDYTADSSSFKRPA